jgi:hypothetical protein
MGECRAKVLATISPTSSSASFEGSECIEGDILPYQELFGQVRAQATSSQAVAEMEEFGVVAKVDESLSRAGCTFVHVVLIDRATLTRELYPAPVPAVVAEDSTPPSRTSSQASSSNDG